MGNISFITKVIEFFKKKNSFKATVVVEEKELAPFKGMAPTPYRC